MTTVLESLRNPRPEHIALLLVSGLLFLALALPARPKPVVIGALVANAALTPSLFYLWLWPPVNDSWLPVLVVLVISGQTDICRLAPSHRQWLLATAIVAHTTLGLAILFLWLTPPVNYLWLPLLLVVAWSARTNLPRLARLRRTAPLHTAHGPNPATQD